MYLKNWKYWKKLNIICAWANIYTRNSNTITNALVSIRFCICFRAPHSSQQRSSLTLNALPCSQVSLVTWWERLLRKACGIRQFCLSKKAVMALGDTVWGGTLCLWPTASRTWRTSSGPPPASLACSLLSGIMLMQQFIKKQSSCLSLTLCTES